MSKQRLDLLLVEQGHAESRSQAQQLIRAGLVRLGDRVVDKPGMRMPGDSPLVLKERPRFVSRGGEKLAAALEHFKLDVSGLVVADVGASTGGFTDCLLQHGASKIYAIDVGYGQLDWRLRNDIRVVVMERTNARYLESLPEGVDLATFDVAFISLRLVVPAALEWSNSDAQIVALIKPQFEAGRRDVTKGGVVRDSDVHRRVVADVVEAASRLGLGLRGLMVSPLTGPSGNIEFLGWWQLGSESVDRETEIALAMEQSNDLRPRSSQEVAAHPG